MKLRSLYDTSGHPIADLRVHSKLYFDFICPACQGEVKLYFGWITTGESHIDHVSDEERKLVNRFLSGRRGARLVTQYDKITCESCGTSYIAASEIEETSFGAYVVKMDYLFELAAKLSQYHPNSENVDLPD